MDTDSLIRERAYLLWEQAGRPHGRSEEFWRAAVAEVAALAEPVATVAAPPAKPVAQKTVARRKAGAAVSSRTAAKHNGGAVASALSALAASAAGAEAPLS